MQYDCILSLSGGMDSGTLLAELVYQKKKPLAIGFVYPSKHNEYEIAAARKLAKFFNVPFMVVNTTDVFNGISSNLLRHGGDIPEGHYNDESMKKTVVPGRNTIFTSILTGMAESRGIPEIYIGIHSGDHAIYPDCRPRYYASMRSVIQDATENKVTLLAPYIHMDKTYIIAQGKKVGMPYELTRTCYKAQLKACGMCGSCCERLEAFANNNMEDPIEYVPKTI